MLPPVFDFLNGPVRDLVTQIYSAVGYLGVALWVAIESVIVGKTDVVRLGVTCLLARGHVLLEDIPGIGKTALARARNKWGYEPTTDIAVLGAAYAFGLATSHPFRDGNKRIAFLTMVVFLGLNGFDFDAPEAEVVTMMVAAADHRASEADLTAWIRQHMKPLPR